MAAVITSVDNRWTSEPGKRIVDPDVLLIEGPPGTGKTSVVIETMKMMEARRKPRASGNGRWYSRVSPQRLAGLAVFIAGRKRASPLRDEWRSHLSEKTSIGLSRDRQVREAAGFLRAAVGFRLQDAADLVGRPVDAVLASRGASNLFVLLATLSVSVLFFRQGGLNGLADNLGNVAVVWGAAFGLIHVGRQCCDVKPLERTPRRSRR